MKAIAVLFLGPLFYFFFACLVIGNNAVFVTTALLYNLRLSDTSSVLSAQGCFDFLCCLKNFISLYRECHWNFYIDYIESGLLLGQSKVWEVFVS